MTKQKERHNKSKHKMPTTPEEIDAVLRGAGLDPDALCKRMMARIQPLLDEAKRKLEESDENA